MRSSASLCKRDATNRSSICSAAGGPPIGRVAHEHGYPMRLSTPLDSPPADTRQAREKRRYVPSPSTVDKVMMPLNAILHVPVADSNCG